MPKRILIKGVPFDQITRVEAVTLILDFLQQDKQSLVTTPNPEFLVETMKNPEFKKVLEKADLSVADGIGILWAATYLDLVGLSGGATRNPESITNSNSSIKPNIKVQDSGQARKTNNNNYWLIFKTLLWTLFTPQKIRKILPERVCGSDLFLDLCRESRAKIFLLGAREGVAEQTAEVLKKQFPQIQIVGTYAGSPRENEENEIVNLINQSGAELLFVAYGSPKQEMWIDRNLSKMPKVKVAMGIGGSFDFVAGVQKRAPLIFRKLGLEWLYRLIREPKRFKRIWNATGVFVGMVVRK